MKQKTPEKDYEGPKKTMKGRKEKLMEKNTTPTPEKDYEGQKGEINGKEHNTPSDTARR